MSLQNNPIHEIYLLPHEKNLLIFGLILDLFSDCHLKYHQLKFVNSVISVSTQNNLAITGGIFNIQ